MLQCRSLLRLRRSSSHRADASLIVPNQYCSCSTFYSLGLLQLHKCLYYPQKPMAITPRAVINISAQWSFETETEIRDFICYARCRARSFLSASEEVFLLARYNVVSELDRTIRNMNDQMSSLFLLFMCHEHEHDHFISVSEMGGIMTYQRPLEIYVLRK